MELLLIKKSKQNYPNSSKNYYKSNKYILMTFHPVTMAKESIPDIMESVINFIFNLNTYSILITYPNNDDGYEEILKVIYKYEKYNS